MKPTEDDNILIGLSILAGLAVPAGIVAVSFTNGDPFIIGALLGLIVFGSPIGRVASLG